MSEMIETKIFAYYNICLNVNGLKVKVFEIGLNFELCKYECDNIFIVIVSDISDLRIVKMILIQDFSAVQKETVQMYMEILALLCFSHIEKHIKNHTHTHILMI